MRVLSRMVNLLADRWHRLLGGVTGGLLGAIATLLIWPYLHLGGKSAAKEWFLAFTVCFVFVLGAMVGAALVRHLGRAIPTLLPRAQVVRRPH